MKAESTLFVTGGAGFIGSNFVRYWAAHHPNDRLVVYDALTYAGCRENLEEFTSSPRFRFIRGDICDLETARAALKETRPDVVVNFAAESHNSRAIDQPDLFYRTNLMGTETLLQAAREAEVGRFHHISTCEVYGDLPLDSEESFTEDSPLRPRTPYSASKACADLAVRAFHLTYGLPVTISNCCNNYGPRQFPEKLIPHFTTRALRGEKLPLYRSSHNRREWIHVEDHCRGIEAVLLHGRIGEAYNIGTGLEADIETIADLVLDELGLDASFKTYVPDRPSHDRRYLLDSRKIREELGWTLRIPFEQGVRETIRWYAQNRAWWTPLLERLSVNEAQWGR